VKAIFVHRLAFLILGTLCAVLLQACRQESYWEQTLLGPFSGEPFKGELSTKASSSVQLPSGFVLDVHWEEGIKDPIIRLREAKGTSLWTRVLIPRLEGQEEPRGHITALTLTEVKRANEGVKVMVLCDWTGGGKERGIVYLDTNYVFRSFALGW
jgi:hypothetical protein